MAKKAAVKNKKLYTCKVCGLKYADKKMAEKCQTWCKGHPNTCDPEITKHSIGLSRSLKR